MRACVRASYALVFQTNQGIKNYPVDEAAVTAGTNPFAGAFFLCFPPPNTQ